MIITPGTIIIGGNQTGLQIPGVTLQPPLIGWIKSRRGTTLVTVSTW